jgi:hypothetical protein
MEKRDIVLEAIVAYKLDSMSLEDMRQRIRTDLLNEFKSRPLISAVSEMAEPGRTKLFEEFPYLESLIQAEGQHAEEPEDSQEEAEHIKACAWLLWDPASGPEKVYLGSLEEAVSEKTIGKVFVPLSADEYDMYSQETEDGAIAFLTKIRRDRTGSEHVGYCMPLPRFEEGR